jgi:hypothetical protein
MGDNAGIGVTRERADNPMKLDRALIAVYPNRFLSGIERPHNEVAHETRKGVIKWKGMWAKA